MHLTGKRADIHPLQGKLSFIYKCLDRSQTAVNTRQRIRVHVFRELFPAVVIRQLPGELNKADRGADGSA
ncbi:hypothetical protein SDC9_165606 [bioreactor metagenome]|uniref:Uncharacterized protein n=1 Tax=bioreactor metagenome TaxID=1076179 RepID=A0A645FUQ7_9ZZZZ